MTTLFSFFIAFYVLAAYNCNIQIIFTHKRMRTSIGDARIRKNM